MLATTPAVTVPATVHPATVPLATAAPATVRPAEGQLAEGQLAGVPPVQAQGQPAAGRHGTHLAADRLQVPDATMMPARAHRVTAQASTASVGDQPARVRSARVQPVAVQPAQSHPATAARATVRRAKADIRAIAHHEVVVRPLVVQAPAVRPAGATAELRKARATRAHSLTAHPSQPAQRRAAAGSSQPDPRLSAVNATARALDRSAVPRGQRQHQSIVSMSIIPTASASRRSWPRQGWHHDASVRK